MKARPFFNYIAAVLLSLFLLTGGLLWGVDRRSPLRLAQQPMQLPRASLFVPRDADLSLHWLADPARLPAYVQAVAPPALRRAARDGARQWRDGVFALAGLDFEAELGNWLGPEVSLTLIDAGDLRDQPGWVLALTSRDTDGARRFLQRFWQTRSLAGTDLQVSSYRGIGVISGRGALLGRDAQPLATALIDDDLLLLASGRGVLEGALDVSQLQDHHQLGDEELQDQLNQLGQGVALMTASPRALKRWLDMPEEVAERQDLEGLVAALRPDGSDLSVNALLRFRDPLEAEPWLAAPDSTLVAGGKSAVMAWLQNPSRLLDRDDQHPYVQWFGPLLRDHLAPIPAAAGVVSQDDGPLLWLQQLEGWLLASRNGHPKRVEVDAELEAQGLSQSDLPGDRETVQVWTRLVRQRGHGEKIAAQLSVATVEDGDWNWWGETLPTLTHRHDSRALQPRLRQWQQLRHETSPSQAVLMGEDPAQQLIRRWRPWTLLQGLSGHPLQNRVRGLVLSVDGDAQAGGKPLLPLHARLELG